MKLKFDLVLFDFDGTLIDTIPASYEAVRTIFRRLSLTPPSLIEYCEHYMPPYLEFYQKRGVNISDEQIWRWYKEIANHHTADLFPEVPSVIDHRTGPLVNLRIGIVSSQKKSVIVDQLKRGGIHKHFSWVKGEAHDKNEAIHEIVTEAHGRLATTLFVGDFGHDIIHAKKAGVTSVGITRGLPTREMFDRLGATYCIENLNQLIPIVLDG